MKIYLTYDIGVLYYVASTLAFRALDYAGETEVYPHTIVHDTRL